MCILYNQRDATYDMIYLLTAIGLSPGGSSTVHIYTQTIHRTIPNKQYIEQHNNFRRVRAVPPYTMFFVIISAVNVPGRSSAHHQELIKLYVQSWVLSCFPAVYRWCGWVGTHSHQR